MLKACPSRIPMLVFHMDLEDEGWLENEGWLEDEGQIMKVEWGVLLYNR